MEKQESARVKPRTSAEWLKHFSENAKAQREIPWQLGADAPKEEVERISPSLQAWQLGETSDGSHLLSAAKSYAAVTGDQQFIDVVRYFIKEEQRHGEMLGRFLDSAGVPRVEHNWGDSLFRTVRYAFSNMEVWATPVLMVETMALIYYRAIRDATRSRVLKAICEQVLHDEVAHIRFQYERLAILHRSRKALPLALTYLAQRILFFAVCTAVWLGHHRAFRAGGYGFMRYWKSAWKKMNYAWLHMNPQRYCFEKAPEKSCMQTVQGVL